MENQWQNTGEKVENAGKSVANAIDHKWKSARNAFSTRLNDDIVLIIAGGVGLYVSLCTTYYEMAIQAQAISYITTFSFMMLFDPLHLFRRLLSTASRVLIFIVSVLFIGAIIMNKGNMWSVFIIAAVIFISLVYFLNDFWLRAESWKMSREVEHALQIDDDNVANKSWQAEGRDNTHTILRSLGFTPTDDDLDYQFKASYNVGYWNCLKVYNNQKSIIDKLEYKVDCKNEDIRNLNNKIEELEELLNEYRDTNSNFEKIRKLYMDALDKITILEEEMKTVPEDIDESDSDGENEEMFPFGITIKQYEEVIELLDKNEPVRSIERITGVKRYRINQIKEEHTNETRRSQMDM